MDFIFSNRLFILIILIGMGVSVQAGTVPLLNTSIDNNPTYPLTPEDKDRDGYSSDVDCDDNDSSVNPGAAEYPNNGVDENCDGIVLYIDDDNDGFHSGVDCDDNNPNIHLYVYDIPNNGIDEDCDGQDAQAPSCEGTAGTIATGNGFNNIFVCSGDNVPDIYSFTTTSTATNFVFLLVNEQNIVIGQIFDRIDFEGSPAERCRIIGIAYTGNLLITHGDHLTSTPISDGCSDISTNSVTIHIENSAVCGIEDQRVIQSANQGDKIEKIPVEIRKTGGK